MSFWDRFYDLCVENGKKPNPVAKEIGISSGIISKWKNEGNLPNGETLKTLASYFDVSVDYLLGRTDTKKGTDPNSQSTDEQTKLIIDKFYSLDEDSQRKAVSYLEFLLASQEQSDNQ